MNIKVGDTEYKAEFNAFTPIVFSRCFTAASTGGTRRPKDISEAVGLIAETMQTVGIPSVTGLLEIFYACIKTANRDFDVPFTDWVEGFPADAYDMQNGDSWAADVMGIVTANFFPGSSARLGAEAAEEAGTAAAEEPE